MANDYSKFDEVIGRLLRGRNSIEELITTINNFSGKDLGKFLDRKEGIWDGLIQYLQNEYTEPKLNHPYGIRQKDFSVLNDDEDREQTVVEYITDNVDLIDTFLDSIFEGSQTHWNESFQRLVEYYKEHIMDPEMEIDSTNIHIGDLLRADAGYDFDTDYVKPTINIDGDRYASKEIGGEIVKGVRGNDEIIRVLKNSDNLQFTKNILKKYLRLLMPEYERIVEVEDLNRNFWVIGQVLTGICSYLFDDFPFKKLFEGMADEVAQLWENLLYLWVGFAIISQDYYREKPIVVVMPVPISELTPYVKFDNIYDKKIYSQNDIEHGQDQANLLIYCEMYLHYLTKIYNKTSLIIIPEIRYCPYGKNYYAASMYPGAILYNYTVVNRRTTTPHGTDQELDSDKCQILYFPFVFTTETEPDVYSYERFKVTTVGANDLPIIGPKEFSNSIFGLNEENSYYNLINNYQGGGTDSFYIGAIRTIFDNCRIIYNADGTVNTLSINCRCEDVGKVLDGKSDTDSKLFEGTFSGPTTAIINEDAPISQDCLVCEVDANTFNDTAQSVTDTPVEITQGWYRGEVPSWGIKK